MGKHKIVKYRERMDKALFSSTLTDEKSLKSHVKDQLNRPPFTGIEDDILEDVLEKRTNEVSNFLEMLRSVAGKATSKGKSSQHNDWKLKQDDDEVRIMYREGPSGAPFHTLLAEGYVDAPLDVCLCVSWESTLYPKWWPQFSFPQFKIDTSTCLQKVRTGENISLVRMKVPWPLSAREALLHYFELEYFEGGLVVVVLNSIADTDKISMKSHGFTSDGIPETSEIVRMDVFGGFAIQKVNENRCYFRTIANLDIKVDFIPSALINFISRQLIGSGFRLYQKAVTSVAKGNEDYNQALAENPMYARLLQISNASKIPLKNDLETLEDEIVSEDLVTDSANASTITSNHEFPTYDIIEQGQTGTANVLEIIEQEQIGTANVLEMIEQEQTGTANVLDIIEQEQTGSANVFEEEPWNNHSSTSSIFGEQLKNAEGTFISTEVEWALGVLNRAIAHFQSSASPSIKSVHLVKTAQATSTTSSYQNSEVSYDNYDIIDVQEADITNNPSEAIANDGSFSFPVFSDSPATESPATESDNLKSASTSIKQIFPTSIKPKVRDLSILVEPSTDASNNGEAGAVSVLKLYNGAHQAKTETNSSKLHNPTSHKTREKKGKKPQQCCFWIQR